MSILEFLKTPPLPARTSPWWPLFGRWPASVWVAVILGFFTAYTFMFSVVHPMVDTRVCLARLLDDPLLRLIPPTEWPLIITHDIYYLFTAAGTFALGVRAYRGDHAPFLRFAIAISLQAVFRSLTLSLLPLCRAELLPGTIPLERVATLDLGLFEIPWRMWATNDLLFSGHAGEFVLMHLATRGHWPRWARLVLWTFQIAQALALVATRGHYTLDIVVAVPFAFFVDAIACAALRRPDPRRPARAAATAPASAL